MVNISILKNLISKVWNESNMSNTEDKVAGCFAAIVIVLVVDLIMAWLVMFLWNSVIPVIFTLPTITYWQAFMLMLLTDILFKSKISVKE